MATAPHEAEAPLKSNWFNAAVFGERMCGQSKNPIRTTGGTVRRSAPPVRRNVRMKEMAPTESVEMIRLPKWAAGSHRALMKRILFIQGFPLCEFPRDKATPFAKERDGWHFVYMTNRTAGRYSYLFEKEPTPKEVREFPIQAGYTALWVLKKTVFFRGAGRETLLFRDRIAKPPDGRRFSEGEFVVLQDPLLKTTSNDVVFAGTQTDSIDFARQAVDEFRCSLLVAELIQDENWH